MFKKLVPDFVYTGWELSPDCLLKLQDIYLCHERTSSLNILEFGSGKSTQFFIDFIKLNNIENYNITSFDANKNYAHPLAKIVPLKIYGQNFHFYDISENDLKNENFYDIVIVDGHDGPGRSMAFGLMKNWVREKTIVIIDDYDHYPFERDFLLIYPNSKLLCRHWEEDNRWLIYEIF